MPFSDQEVAYLRSQRLARLSPRFLRVYGTAELVERGAAPYMRITPTVSWSFNLDGESSTRDAEFQRTVHEVA